ncbi:AMP-binding protein [uncultured Fibrella sp.]|uniref:AMP-binding protein n=1 Tax=uncultured Fibrella sp. TaxID=1284596 RepID=UPI0035C9F615
MTTNFYGLIHEKLLEQPDRELIVWPGPLGQTCTYTGKAILDRVSLIRTTLAGENVLPGQQVLLAMPVSFELICSLLAIMALGAIPVLPPAAATVITLFSILKQEGIETLLTAKKLTFPLSWLVKRSGINLITTNPKARGTTTYLAPQAVDPEQPALISHSSGSTGKPKAIRRSHRVLTAQHQALSVAFPPWSGQRDFPLFPNILLHNLAVGSVSILPDLPRFALAELDPGRITQQLLKQDVHTLTGNVYYFQQLIRYWVTNPQEFPAVRAVGIGGSPVPESLIDALTHYFTRADIFIIYGSSEAEPIAIRNAGLQRTSLRSGYVVGSIHPAIQVNVRPLGMLTLPDGRTYTTGELEVKGRHVATAETDWLPTGDFGYIDEDNQLILTGRKGNEQIHKGVQHYQLEHVLSAVAGVDRVAARATDTGFILYVQGTATETDLEYALEQHFPAGICSQILFRNQLPVDARHLSKIRYDRLR